MTAHDSSLDRPTVSGELPSGTVTFLLTDIEGSTALWDTYPDAMSHALNQHERVVAGVERVHAFGGGTAVFAGVAGPHKCGGAIQKATYLAADEFRRRGVLDESDVVLATPAESIFGVSEFADPLSQFVERRDRHALRS
jgi:class 3 adenylate cyclase